MRCLAVALVLLATLAVAQGDDLPPLCSAETDGISVSEVTIGGSPDVSLVPLGSGNVQPYFLRDWAWE